MSTAEAKPAARRPAQRRAAGGSFPRWFPWLAGLLLLGGSFYAFADSGGGGRKLLQDALRSGSLTTESATALLASYGIASTTKAGGLEIREFCKREHSAELAQHFLNKTRDVPFWTACPHASWIEELAKISPGGKTFVDIGCNKGYSSSHFFALWAPEVGFAPNTVQARRPDILCGTCGDCKDEPKSPVQKSKGEPVSVYCVEPSLRNYANLIGTRDAFFSSSTPEHVQWYLVNAAVSNDTGIVKFPRGCVDELCSLDGNSDGTRTRDFDHVHLVSVDALLKDLEIPHVDVLKIDTEGYDATVIAGAMEALARGAIDIVSFEYHEVGVWREYQLRSIVDRLQGLDFVCYYDGKPDLTRLTGCWDDTLEAYAWSNVVCVKRSHALYPITEKLSTRYQLHKDEYYGGGKADDASGSSEQKGQ